MHPRHQNQNRSYGPSRFTLDLTDEIQRHHRRQVRLNRLAICGATLFGGALAVGLGCLAAQALIPVSLITLIGVWSINRLLNTLLG